MKKIITKAIILCMAVFVLVGCSSKDSNDNNEAGTNNETKKIILGTNAEFPPFEYANSDGTFDGFDIALVNEIAKKMNTTVEVKNMQFKSLIGAIETGAINAIAAGMTVTDERKKSVDFSQVYFEAKQHIVVMKDSKVKTLSDLDGKKVAVQEGTTGDFIASGDTDMAVYVKDAKVSRFDKASSAIMDLKTGRVDAVIIDSNVAAEFLKENSDLRSIEEKESVDNYAIAVKKGDAELLEAINKAIDEIKADGTYDKLVQQYIVK